MMRKRLIALLLVLFGSIAPTSYSYVCNWGAGVCVTVNCGWGCYVTGYGNWEYTCTTYTDANNNKYCCRCSRRDINCFCIPGPETGYERIRREFVDDQCVSQGTGECLVNNPNE